jgi:hypothetical protein
VEDAKGYQNQIDAQGAQLGEARLQIDERARQVEADATTQLGAAAEE